MARLTLAQQLALLDDPAPQDIDPEDASRPLNGGGAEHEHDDQSGGSGSEGEAPDGREHYLDVGRSALRGLDPELEKPKYAGVQVDRMKIFDDDEDEEDDLRERARLDDEDEEEGLDEAASANGEGPQEDKDEDDDDDDEDNGEGDDEEMEAVPPPKSLPTPSPARPTSPPPATPTAEPTSDAQKALAVTHQLSTLDTILSTRIALQKLVLASNRLPLPGKIAAYAESEEGREALEGYMKEAEAFSDELFELREGLLKLNEKVEIPQRPLKRKRAAEVFDHADMEEFVKQATHHHVLLSAASHPSTLQTLHKWSQKILAVHPTLLVPSSTTSGANTKTGTSRFSAHRNQPPKGVVQVIDEVLRETREKLRERSRARDVRPVGADEDDGEGGEEETFDDAEFYGSLLREVIESRRGTATALDELLPSSSRKARQKKKKEVDTKASKGRKLRFEVHEKVQHFMFPRLPQTAWGEAQIDELFGSLLGKGMGETRVGEQVGVDGANGVDPGDGKIEVGQLRVFG